MQQFFGTRAARCQFFYKLLLSDFSGVSARKRKSWALYKGFNFFVGSNNSGKSTVLDLIHRYLSRDPKVLPLDVYTGAKTGAFYVSVGILEGIFQNAALEQLRSVSAGRHDRNRAAQCEQYIKLICESLARDGGVVWDRLRKGNSSGLTVDANLTRSVNQYWVAMNGNSCGRY